MVEDHVRPTRRNEARPLYAMLVTFPIACFILTFLSDLAYWTTASFLWETVSAWLLTAGLLVAGVTVLAGLVDLVRSRPIQGLGQPWLAVVGQGVAFGLSVVNVFVHSRDGYTAVVPQGLSLSALVVLVLLVTTIMGRSMTSRRHVGGLA